MNNTQPSIFRIMLFTIFICITLMSFEAAKAATDKNTTTGDNVVGTVFCRLIKEITGPIARAIATIAIFMIGVGLFLGKINWGVAFATAAGVAMIFGAQEFAKFLSGESWSECNEVLAR